MLTTGVGSNLKKDLARVHLGAAIMPAVDLVLDNVAGDW
jgi:hypothetical protein